MTKTRHVDYPRSAVIVFRLYFKILPISQKASYADSRTLYGLGCPPHTHSHSGGSGALRSTHPTVSSVEKPTRLLAYPSGSTSSKLPSEGCGRPFAMLGLFRPSASIASAHFSRYHIGISFQSVLFSSFHCLVTDVKIIKETQLYFGLLETLLFYHTKNQLSLLEANCFFSIRCNQMYHDSTT